MAEVSIASQVARKGQALAMVVGADIGGTKLSTVLVDADRVVRHRTWAEHASASFEDILLALEDAVSECKTAAATLGATVSAVGVAVAAWLSADRERVVLGANIGAHQLELAAKVRERLKLPVVLENDGDATALAEYRAAGARSRSFVAMTFGTGVGGGIVIDGRLLSGASGLGGELGHIPVKVGGAPCVCGGRGCLELEASGRAIALAGQAKTSAEVVSRAQAGDTGAVTVLTNAGCAIGTAVKILVPAVGPETVVLTGALAHGAGDFILPAARSVLDEDRPLSIVRQAPRIEIGRLGPYAGAIGAAELARSATPALAPSSGALD